MSIKLYFLSQLLENVFIVSNLIDNYLKNILIIFLKSKVI